ncbi:hypothetical protein [Halomonas sp. JB37]|uniref:hypothetical protein n=1 Tax=Halomonas sp. JB37 TaxID=2024405 RepID=UPI000BB83F5F|nr:hypothetical protein [Halomonas sp. JB37]PCC20596.1 hypothetical protein CIK78_17690 [Halomonas sp. JB37]
MNDLNYRGTQISFWQLQGEVLDSDRYSRTHVEAHGSAGYGRAPSVRVNQTTHHDFWIREDDGSERSIQLEDVNVPLRAGQRVTVICASHPDSQRGWLCSLVNHSTGQAHEIIPAKTLQQRLRLERMTGVSLVLALVVGALVVFLTLPSSDYFAYPWRMVRWDWAIAAAIAVLVWRAWRKLRRSDRAANALKEHIGNAVSRVQRHRS